jgi:glycosyltransferase involved in cell wall biosynthesis
MNAFVIEREGAYQALWLDLNSVRAASAEAVALDVAGFLSLTLWPALLDARQHSPGLFQDLASAYRGAPDVLAAASEALEAARADVVEGDARTSLARAFRAEGPLERTDLLGAVHRRLAALTASSYFLDQTRSDQNARFYSTLLNVERTRNAVLEEERTRLHYERFHRELERANAGLQELRAWSEEERKAIAFQVQRAETSEAQLRANEQQLRTNEQQFRTSEQELRASEAQLRAHEAQLRANEQQIMRLEEANARLSAESQEARAAVAALHGEIAKRDDLDRSLREREAYRFMRVLIEVKADPMKAWKIPIGAVALVTPKALRERVRQQVCGALSRSRRALQEFAVRERRWPADQPLVSVIVPCFNYGRFVREAVDAVLAQTLKDLEIIVVEGGSTDGVTPQVVRDLRHSQLRTIFQHRQTPVGKNRLAGLRAARGKYVVFLDADDLIEPTYLEKGVMALELTGVDIVYPTVQLFGRENLLWETGDEFTLSGLAVCNMVPTVAMFRIETWREKRIGYGTHLDLEDYDFWLRFAERGAKGIKIHEPLMRYRVHGNSLTDAIRHRHEEAATRIREEHAPRLRPSRVARISEAQRQRVFRPDRQANLDRIVGPSTASLRIAIANPFLVLGGSDHLLQQVFANCSARDASLLVYSTLAAPASMGSSAAGYAGLTRDVFELPKELPPETHSEAILHLLRSRRTNTLLIVGSRATYELLPRIKAKLPDLKVVDHLYNAVGHLSSNREFARYIDFHIVANEEVRRALLERREPAERIEVIHHGIDMARYAPGAVPRRDDLDGLHLDPEQRLVLFAGRLSEEKGALRYLDIAAQLGDAQGVTVAMIGDGPMRQQVEERALQLGLGGRVHRLGFVPDARPYLRRADVVVIPSDIDGLPLVALEALALGTPVVASRLGALPEVIEPGRTGAILDPQDVEGFVRAIDGILTLERTEVASRCRRSVEERFAIERVRDRYFGVFQRVVGIASPLGAGAKEVA